MSKNYKLKTGDILKDRFKIIKLIGSGGMGSTYQALDTTTEKDVALKVVALSHIQEWKELELFEREVAALKNLDHPQIPDYIDNFETGLGTEKVYVLVQEYVDGKDFYQAVKNGTTYSQDEVFRIFRQLLEILDYIHNLKPAVIHRDINPKNISMDENNKIYLLDFGAVGKLSKTTISAANKNTIVGTLGYMPREQYYSKVSAASDLYALGVTIVFLLTGKQPSEFNMQGMKIDFQSQVNLPDYAVKLLLKMTEPVMEKRLQSASEALKILKRKKFLSDVKVVHSLDEVVKQLIMAEQDADFDQLCRIVERLGSINVCNSQGRSLLKIMLDKNNIPLAKYLIQQGADVNFKYKGKALIHDAVIDGDFQKTELLLKNNALINILDNNTWCPIEYAYEYHFDKIKQLLLDYGAIDTVKEQQDFFLNNLPEKPRRIPYKFKFHLRNELKQNSFFTSFFAAWLFFCLIGHFFMANSPRFPGELLFAGEIVTAEGVITGKEVNKIPWLDNSIDKYFFKYKTPDGRQYEDYSYNNQNTRVEGQSVTIEYIPGSPGIARIRGMDFTFLSEDMGLAGAVIFSLIVLLYSIILFLPKYRRAIHLLKKGRISKGTVYENLKTGSRKSSSKTYYDKYAYEDEIKGKSKHGEYFNNNNFYALKGSKVPVLYLPKKRDYSLYLPPLFIGFKKDSWYFKKKQSILKHLIFTFIRYCLGFYIIGFILIMIIELF